MKVLYVSPWAHRPIHFAPAAVRETSRLKEAGLDVTLLTCCGLVDPAFCLDVPHRTVFAEGGLFYRMLPYLYRWKPLKWLAGFLELISTLGYGLALYRQDRFDVLHIRDGEPLVFLPFLLTAYFFNKVRCVVVLVSSSNHIAAEAPVNGRRLLAYRTLIPTLNNLKLWGSVCRRSLSRNSFIVVCPDKFSAGSYRRYLQGVFLENIRVVPFGIERPKQLASLAEARRKLGLPAGKNLFLLFGGIHPWKDPESVIMAFKDRIEAVQVIIAGISVLNEGFSKIRTLVGEHHLEDSFLIVERFIPETDKEWYFRASNAVLLPYKAQFRQSASTLWEACRFLKPVIASRIEPLEDVSRYGLGLSFEPQDGGSLREKILEFLSLSEEAKRQMEKNCDRFCRDFSSDKWVKEYTAIYADLLSRGRK